MMDARAAWRTLVMMPVAIFALGFAALFAPRLLLRDALPETPPGVCQRWGTRPCAPEAARRLKTQARARFDFPIGWGQVTEARLYGDTPDHVDGAVILRAPFGVPVAEVRLAGQETRQETRHVYSGQLLNWPLAWGAFLLAEGALGLGFGRRLWRQLGLESPL